MAGSRKLEDTGYDEIAKVAKEHIPTWKDVDLSQIEIKEVSGLGGSKTFKVSICLKCSGASVASADIIPAAVVLQIRSSSSGSNKSPLLRLHERTMAAGLAFANAGIGPSLIAKDEDLCIHEWAGEAIVEKFMGPGCESESTGVIPVEKMFGPEEFRSAVGHLLGRIHRVPVTWADSFANTSKHKFLLSDKFPTLGCLGTDVLTTGSLEKNMSQVMLGRWEVAIDGLRTSHPLAQNIVTLHADFHCGNILINPESDSDGGRKLAAIDFEFANTGPAEFDLGYAFVVNKALLNSASNKRAFVKGYVKGVSAAGSAISSSDQIQYTDETVDVENLLVDCEIASVKSWPPGEFIGVPDSIDTVRMAELVKRLAEFCTLARVRPVEDDESCSKEKEMHAASLKREELLNKGAFALIREWHNEA